MNFDSNLYNSVAAEVDDSCYVCCNGAYFLVSGASAKSILWCTMLYKKQRPACSLLVSKVIKEVRFNRSS